MSKRKYEKVQPLHPEIRAMAAAGKTHREIAEHFGFSDKFVVKRLLKRERDKEAKLRAASLVYHAAVTTTTSNIWISQLMMQVWPRSFVNNRRNATRPTAIAACGDG